jgi:hypothetical protein
MAAQDTIPERLTRVEDQLLSLNEMIVEERNDRVATAVWRARIETKLDVALYGGVGAILGIVLYDCWRSRRGSE